MNKRDALKLRAGDTITFGSSMWTARVAKAETGQVVSVTLRGGIKVRVSSGAERWVPYHHAIRVVRT